MKSILTLIGGGDRDEVILQTAFAAASAGYIRRADDAAFRLVETRDCPRQTKFWSRLSPTRWPSRSGHVRPSQPLSETRNLM
jgi:hypothetical protein